MGSVWLTLGNVSFNVASRRPYKGFSNIQFVQDGGNGSYNALSVKATRRFSQGLSVIGSYTWAKSIDTTSGIRNQGFDTLYPQNSYCLSCERALSAFDARHRMVTSVLYDLPVGRGRHFGSGMNHAADAVVGGWALNGILTLRTGVPITMVGANCHGVWNRCLPDYAPGYSGNGNTPPPGGRTPNEYFNISDFVEAYSNQPLGIATGGDVGLLWL